MIVDRLFWLIVFSGIFFLGFIFGKEFNSGLSDVVLAAIFASLLTLSGVMLSNLNARKMHLDKLKHDSDESDRNREMELKKDVYIKTADAITNMISIIPDMGNLNISHEQIQDSVKIYRGQLTGIQIIGNDKTVQSVSNLSQEVAKSILNLLLKRYLIVMRKSKIEINNNLAEKMSKKLDEQIELMHQMNLDGNTIPSKWDVIKNNVEFYTQQRDEYQNNNLELNKLLIEEQAEFVKICFDEFVRLSKLSPDILFAIRNELNLQINENEYIQTLNRNLEEGKKFLQEYIEEAKKLADNQ